MAQGPWIVAQLPTASGNTVLQPSWRPSDGQQISWVPTCRATICTGAGSVTHTWRATERRLHFDSPTRTRVNSDLSVNDGYCFRLFSVDTSPSTYFSPFPSRTLHGTRTMTDSGQLRSSISLLGNHAEFLLSWSTSALNTLQASHALWFLLEETETSTNGQNSKVSWHSIVDQSARIDLPVFGRSAASGRSGWRRDFSQQQKVPVPSLYPARCLKLLAMTTIWLPSHNTASDVPTSPTTTATDQPGTRLCSTMTAREGSGKNKPFLPCVSAIQTRPACLWPCPSLCLAPV